MFTYFIFTSTQNENPLSVSSPLTGYIIWISFCEDFILQISDLLILHRSVSVKNTCNVFFKTHSMKYLDEKYKNL